MQHSVDYKKWHLGVHLIRLGKASQERKCVSPEVWARLVRMVFWGEEPPAAFSDSILAELTTTKAWPSPKAEAPLTTRAQLDSLEINHQTNLRPLSVLLFSAPLQISSDHPYAPQPNALSNLPIIGDRTHFCAHEQSTPWSAAAEASWVERLRWRNGQARPLSKARPSRCAWRY
jgi:hypothetical protein